LFCMSAAHAAEQTAPAQGGAASGVGKALFQHPQYLRLTSVTHP
jgi:hypothetical protein